jgi:ferredoxin-2, mitochondrial
MNSVTINWKNKSGEVKVTTAKIGTSLLQVAHREEIDLEGRSRREVSPRWEFAKLILFIGACGGVCACSTCHVILEQKVYDGLPEASEEEEDMLDLAFGLTATSRLGCQIILDKSHEGMTVQLPSATRNFYVDGHVPKPH